MYKIQKGKPGIISNANITDELAIEFLTYDPKRISVFSTYPKNYLELISDVPVDITPKTDVVDLNSYNVKELKELYPDVKYGFGMSKIKFIESINNSNPL